VKISKYVAGVALVAMTAACGGGGDSSSGSDNGPATLNVAYVPYNGNAPTFLGIDKNIYGKQNLTLNMQVAQAPAAAISSLVSGDVQVAFTTIVTLVSAVSQGTQIRCITPVDGTVSDAQDQLSTATMVMKDSPVQSEADLKGKKVGVVALGSQNHLFTLQEADAAGIDPKSVNVVQLPFAQMQQALTSGQVDAVVATQPFTAQIQAAGGRVVNWPEAELNKGGNGTCYAASEQYIQQHPDIVKRFRDAHTEAINYAKDHVDEARATIPNFMDVTPDIAKNAVLGVDYNPDLNTDSIKKFEQSMKKYGFIDDDVDLDQLVYTP
jgi:NitT/TauT family transport system substrate-binding protein